MLLLTLPRHDRSLLPVPRRSRLLTPRTAARAFRSVLETRKNVQIMNEFRSKMRLAEDLISKLAFSLNEIQHARRRPKKKETKSRKPAAVLLVSDLHEGGRGSRD